MEGGRKGDRRKVERREGGKEIEGGRRGRRVEGGGGGEIEGGWRGRREERREERR